MRCQPRGLAWLVTSLGLVACASFPASYASDEERLAALTREEIDCPSVPEIEAIERSEGDPRVGGVSQFRTQTTQDPPPTGGAERTERITWTARCGDREVRCAVEAGMVRCQPTITIHFPKLRTGE